MGTDDVPFICYYDGELLDDDINAKYNGGKKKLINVPKSIGFTSFKQKIQEVTKLQTNGSEFQIKCAVNVDEFTVIAVDVDDDESLQSVMERSKFIRIYILQDKDVLPATPFTAAQREDLVLPLAATLVQAKIPKDGTSNKNPDDIITTVVKTPYNDEINRNKYTMPSESKLKEWFPETLLPLITDYENPEGDGNCGFRALCMALGRAESEWSWMRAELAREIELNNEFYNMLFGLEETVKLVEGIWHSEGSAPRPKWMDMPSTGFVFAQAFKVVLVHYSKRNCWTFVPPLSSPNAEDTHRKVVGIGFVENNHYIKLGFEDGCPLPPLPLIQSRCKTIRPEIAAYWKELLAPRLNAFIAMNIPELQVDKCPGGRIDLDGSNGDAHEELVKLYRFEELLNLSVSNHEGINSSCINKFAKSLLNNHEYSEGSEVNKPEKMHANVDNHQITVSISSHRSTSVDNMLYMTNQVSSQVCSESSVHYQRTNPLIRNHEDNEADELNMQENMVHKEIQFIFQRKEMITSGHKPAPIPTHDRLDTSVRFPNSNVVPLDKGMINMSVSNHEVNEGNEDMVRKENGYTGQAEQMVPPSDAAIDSSDIDFDIEREYDDIEAFRNSLSDWAVKTGHEYTPARKTPSELKMKCVSEGCKWYIWVSKLPNLSTFKVVKYQGEHSCLGPQHKCGGGDHRQATIKWIVSKMKSSIEKDPEIEPMKIVNEIKNQFGINISYNKAVKAKTKVRELMRNHDDPIPMLAKELEQNGSVVKVGFSSDGSQYLFWAFQACIDALHNHLRPVVYVGSVDTEIGVLMFAQGVDGNQFYGDPIEVGFAVCVREDDKSWETFLGWLKEFVLPPTTAAGIPFSIVTKFEFEETAGLTRAVENVLSHLHHFITPHSFAMGFCKKLEGANFYNGCSFACESFSTKKCEEYLQAIKRSNKEAYSWLMSVGSRSRWAIAYSPNKHALVPWKTERNHIREFASIGEKSLQIIVERSRDMVAKYFSGRQIMGEHARTTGLTPSVMRHVQLAKLFLRLWNVESIDEHKYQVRKVDPWHYPHEWTEVVVNLEEKSCTCGAFQATEYPCDHAFGVIAHLDLDIRNYLGQHKWYSLDTYLKTYAGKLPPPIPDYILDTQIGGVPPKRRKVGRPKKFKGEGAKPVFQNF